MKKLALIFVILASLVSVSFANSITASDVIGGLSSWLISLGIAMLALWIWNKK